MRRVVALALFCLPALAFADCEAQMPKWAKTLHPTLTFDAEHSMCKVSPADDSRTLAALAFVEEGDADGDATYGLEVLSADAATGAIKSHVYQSGAINSDAIQFRSLSLDTARYQLAPGIRAFGVRMDYTGSSRVNPYEATALNLYVEEGQKIRKVLNNLKINESNGEWDGNCEGDFSASHRTLSIGKNASKGFATLMLDSKTVTSHNVPKGDDCNEAEDKPELKKTELSYNGKQYDVPEELNFQ
ncbi:hypothetical protein ACCD10_14445 [Pseudomonas sp. Pseusp122]|uniref:hypothetical protein n=1 Tax=unclassified Pseudomonas TaxID=196821 RepID=UPI0039A47C72